MDNQEYVFFKNNLKRTVLSQSRYLCPRKRAVPATTTLYTSQSVPILPSSCVSMLQSNTLRNSGRSSEDEYKSLTTHTSDKTGLTKKCLKVTIPTARPWSCYSDNSSFQSCYSSDSKSWNNLSPVYVTRHGTMSPGHHVTSPGHHVTSSKPRVTTSDSSTWGSFAEETPDVFGGGSESGKSLSDGSEGKCVGSEDNEQLTDVISGVCLLGSLEDVGNTCNRRQAFSGSIKIVKSVLHRQVP